MTRNFVTTCYVVVTLVMTLLLATHTLRGYHVLKDADNEETIRIVMSDIKGTELGGGARQADRRSRIEIQHDRLDAGKAVSNLVAGWTRAVTVVSLIALRLDDPVVPADLAEGNCQRITTASRLSVAHRAVFAVLAVMGTSATVRRTLSSSTSENQSVLRQRIEGRFVADIVVHRLVPAHEFDDVLKSVVAVGAVDLQSHVGVRLSDPVLDGGGDVEFLPARLVERYEL